MTISWIHWIWITLLVVIIAWYHGLVVPSQHLKEGMTSGCEDVSVQKNAGTIQYLQDAVSKLQETMNKIQIEENKQDGALESLQDQVKQMNEQLSEDTKLSKQNETSLKQISSELQDRIKSHNQRGQQLSNR